jgi:hypothetical protein
VRVGENLIIDGRTDLAEGAAVSPVAVTITPEGVVQDAVPAVAGTAAPAGGGN